MIVFLVIILSCLLGDSMKDFTGDIVKDMERIRSMSPAEREALAIRIRKRAEDSGKVLVSKAISEKVFSRVEWLYFQELGLGFADMDAILHAYFDSRSREEDNVGLLTAIGSPIWVNRDFIFERFKLRIVSQDDLMRKMDGV